MAQLRSIMIHDQVYVSLRRAIMSGHFKPGDQLSARGLAKDFGISQMPVRDALNRLTSDRAVERTGDRRYCIPKLNTEYVADLRTARVINEGAATAIAAGKMTKKAMINTTFKRSFSTVSKRCNREIPKEIKNDMG